MNAKKMLFAGVCLLAACFTQAQESQMPKAFSYQAVVRDNAGKVVADKEVGVKIEILKGSAESGTVVYEETLRPKSTKTGTVNKESRIPSPIQISIIASVLRPNVPNTPILSVDQPPN